MLDFHRSRQTAWMTLLLSFLAAFAALMGVLVPALYGDLRLTGTLSKFLWFGSIAQDLVSLPAALALFILSILFLKRPGPRTLIAALGLSAYFFYGYGLYVMQGQYTSIYPVYLLIFGLSLYSLIWGLLSFEPEAVKRTRLPRSLRLSIALFLGLILLVLVPVWFARMMPDVLRHVPGETYGVFVLDLAIVFPALGIIAVQLVSHHPFGNLFSGVALMKCLTLCLSVAFGQIAGPCYGFPFDGSMIAIFTLLTLASATLFCFYLRAFAACQPGPALTKKGAVRPL